MTCQIATVLSALLAASPVPVTDGSSGVELRKFAPATVSVRAEKPPARRDAQMRARFERPPVVEMVPGTGAGS